MMIKTIALTTDEFNSLLIQQTDPIKRAAMEEAAQHDYRASGDKIYIPADLIDGLRTPVMREEDIL